MLIIDENQFLNEPNQTTTTTTNLDHNPLTIHHHHHHHHDLPLIESWIDFSECTLLHSNPSHFIKPTSNSISSFDTQPVQPPQTEPEVEVIVPEEGFIKPTFKDLSSTSPSASSSLTSPFCDRSSFLTLSPPPISLNDPLPITRTEYGLIDEFWSHISTREHGLGTSGVEESDGILKFVVQQQHEEDGGTEEAEEEEEAEGLRRKLNDRSIEPEPITVTPSRIDPSLLSMNHSQPNLSSSSSSTSKEICKLDVDEILHGFDQYDPQAPNDYPIFEAFEPNILPEIQSPTQSHTSSSHTNHSTNLQQQCSSSSKEPKKSSRVGKRKEFLERNRLAASRSRAKRKQTESMLESRARVLEEQNLRLSCVVEELEFKLRDLKQVLLDVRMMG